MTTSILQKELQSSSELLQSFALKLTNEEASAKDLFQDTIIRIINNQHKFTSGSNFKAWALTIMKNVFINNYRRKMRRKTVHQENFSQLPNRLVESINNSAESNLGYQELMNMINQLEAGYKVPFFMAYQGYKYDEIAKNMDLPVGTIKSRIFIARKKLQEMHLENNPIRA